MKKQGFLTITLFLIIVFILGVIVGKNLDTSQSSKIESFIKNSELGTESFLIEQELLEGLGQSCDLAQVRLSSLSNELWQLGKLLEAYTAERDLGEKTYNLLKRKYHLMQIRTYLLYYKLNKECDIKVPVIVFYFGKKDSDSVEQGKILDKLVEDYDIKVFAVEFGYSEELRFLEDYYGVTETPTLIINYETKKVGLTKYTDIKREITSEN